MHQPKDFIKCSQPQKKEKKKDFIKCSILFFKYIGFSCIIKLGQHLGGFSGKKKKKVTDLSFFLITYKRHKLYGEALEKTKKKVNE